MSEYTEISRFSKEEELANSVSHFTAALLSIIATVAMIIKARQFGSSLHVVSSAVFGSSMILLYLSSGMTHYLKQGSIKNIFFSLDKIAIYVLIAGTYTPLSLVTLNGSLGWVIFGIEWIFAIAGIIMILAKPVRYEKGVNTFSVISYAVMGWLIIVAIVPVIRILPTLGWIMILIGGLCYTIGIFFYKKCSFRHHHLIWHLLVIAGNFFHFLTIYYYVIP